MIISVLPYLVCNELIFFIRIDTVEIHDGEGAILYVHRVFLAKLHAGKLNPYPK